MRLSELPVHLRREFQYPIDRASVIERMGETLVEAPDPEDSQTVEDILAPVGTESFETAFDLFIVLYGNVSEDYIGRKFYDDRGDNPMTVPGAPVDEEDVSF